MVDSPEPHRLAREAALKSIVLLKNDVGATAPLQETLKSVAVIGPAADDEEVLLGNYNGTAGARRHDTRGVAGETGR